MSKEATCVIATFFSTLKGAEEELAKRAAWRAKFFIMEVHSGFYVVSDNARKKLTA